MEIDFKKKERHSGGRAKGFLKMSSVDQKNEQIVFRLSTQEKYALDKVCKISSKTRSDFLRDVLSESIPRVLKNYEQTLF